MRFSDLFHRNLTGFGADGTYASSGLGGSYVSFGPDGVTTGVGHVSPDDHGSFTSFGPQGVSSTVVSGNFATTFGPDGVSNTIRSGNVFTTMHPDGTTSTTYATGSSFSSPNGSSPFPGL